jgi:tRNA(fMet)-specific endonuclease VapC
MWVLDTDHLSLIQRGYPNVKQRCDEIGSTKAITVVTLEEQMKGWLNLINKYNDQPSQSEKLILAYKGMRDTELPHG